MTKNNKKTLEKEQFLIPDRPYKKIALSFIVLTSFLTLIIIYFALSKVTIILEPKETLENKSFSFNIPLNNTSTEIVLTGDKIEKKLEIVKTFEAKTFKTEPGKSSGIITIINKNSKNQTLIENTRFLSPNGLIFRLQETLVIPANSEITGKILADETGDKYDIAPTTFTIPGLNKDLQLKIFGKTTTPTTGGIKKIGRLTTEEITNAQKLAIDELDKDIKNKLEISEDTKNIVFLNKEILKENISNKDGDEVEKYTITINVKVEIIYIEKEKLLNLTKDEYKKQMQTNINLVSYNLESFKYILDNITDKIAKITTSISAYNLKDFDYTTIEKEKLYGLDREGIKYFFSEYDNIKNIEIKFWPFWVKSVPSMADHIEIKVKE